MYMPTNQGGLVNQIAPFEKHGFVVMRIAK